jgi:predicted AAA+ superfamily ATPase
MDELNEELIVLSAIFGEELGLIYPPQHSQQGEEIKLITNKMRISLPLRFGLQLRFLINVIGTYIYIYIHTYANISIDVQIHK